MIDLSQLNMIYALMGIVILVVVAFDLLIGWFLLRQTRDLAAFRRDANQYMQVDLQIKRNKLQQTASKPKDALIWFNTVVSRVTESDSRITSFPASHPDFEPSFLQGLDGDGREYLLAPHSPDALRRLAPSRKSLAGSSQHPLLPLPRGTQVYECSVLSTDNIVFDSEAALLWKDTLHQDLKSNKLWLYILPSKK